MSCTTDVVELAPRVRKERSNRCGWCIPIVACVHPLYRSNVIVFFLSYYYCVCLSLCSMGFNVDHWYAFSENRKARETKTKHLKNDQPTTVPVATCLLLSRTISPFPRALPLLPRKKITLCHQPNHSICRTYWRETTKSTRSCCTIIFCTLSWPRKGT